MCFHFKQTKLELEVQSRFNATIDNPPWSQTKMLLKQSSILEGFRSILLFTKNHFMENNEAIIVNNRFF